MGAYFSNERVAKGGSKIKRLESLVRASNFFLNVAKKGCRLQINASIMHRPYSMGGGGGYASWRHQQVDISAIAELVERKTNGLCPRLRFV